MDGLNFDNLARLAAANSSRRSILTSAFVAALAGLGAASPLGADTAEGKNRKRKRRRRRRNKDDCKPRCGAKTCGGDGCRGSCGTCDDQSFCQDGTCVPCDFPCPAGERCIHGTCTCGASGGNNCPFEGPTDQCACGGQTVDGVGATCADKFSACDIDTPCTTHDDCPVGTVCKTTCVDDPNDPLGPNRCSNPCVPA